MIQRWYLQGSPEEETVERVRVIFVEGVAHLRRRGEEKTKVMESTPKSSVCKAQWRDARIRICRSRAHTNISASILQYKLLENPSDKKHIASTWVALETCLAKTSRRGITDHWIRSMSSCTGVCRNSMNP